VGDLDGAAAVGVLVVAVFVASLDGALAVVFVVDVKSLAVEALEAVPFLTSAVDCGMSVF